MKKVLCLLLSIMLLMSFMTVQGLAEDAVLKPDDVDYNSKVTYGKDGNCRLFCF